MVEDPADGALIGVDRIQIAAAEANAARARVIPQFQRFESRQGGLQWRPQPKTIQQPTAGMGDGVGTAAALQVVCRLRIVENDLIPLLG